MTSSLLPAPWLWIHAFHGTDDPAFTLTLD